MVKAYSYIRFSRPEQLRGDSLRRQTEAANKWAAKRGVVIDESLRDLGVSALRGANRIKGALGRFHDLVEKGQVPAGSYLIVESLDRLSRKAVGEVLPDFMLLINAGIVIVTLLNRQE
ncbi:recombinase family protein [Methylorubrum sp. B1-46]|uniref:recombinase family protein n=1 Tax=Methylorubrum TaxID=2282523 RepID=UPI001E5300FC|nr:MULTISPECIES: recombinase family protein [Methylorubrum]MCG5246896.1 recombinase family protein [Methylorubrum extorquens]UGB24742.1 recombinase family protein [Methylorubrum sp. B1-46]